MNIPHIADFGFTDGHSRYLTTVRTSCTKITVTTSFNWDRRIQFFGNDIGTAFDYRNRY
jgi:hypothetical protein